MNKLVAFAALGLGLAQAVVACSSDSGSTDGTGGTGGKSAGGSGGKASGGSAQAGSGGHGGVSGGATGGSSAGGSAGKGGTGPTTGGTGGTGTGGSSAGAPPEGGAAGDMGGSQAGAAGAPPVEPVMASEYWLNQYCSARSQEVLGCDNSPTWASCFDANQPYLSTTQAAVCPNETDMDNVPLTLAVINAFDTLATDCMSPMRSDMRCNPTTHAPEFIDQTCRDADAARQEAVVACGL